MLSLSHPVLHAFADAQSNFDQLAAAIDAQLAVWQLVQNESGVVPGGTPATTGLLCNGSVMGLSTTGAPPMWRLVPEDLAIPGRATRLRLGLSLAVNATTPGGDWTLALCPVSGIGGGAGVVGYTLGAALCSVTITSPPTAGSPAFSDEFDLPSAAAFVALVLVTSAATAANSRVVVNGRLEMRHT